jgi:5-methylcytosine-specific restriction endonuclease McrA
MTFWQRLKQWLTTPASAPSRPSRPEPVYYPPPAPVSFWDLEPRQQESVWWRQDEDTKAQYLALHPELVERQQQAQAGIAHQRHLRQVDPDGYWQSKQPGDPGWLKAQMVLRGTNPHINAQAQEQALQRTSERLIIHHLTYDHHTQEHAHLGDLITVCDPCHKAAHTADPWLHAPKPYEGYYTQFVSSPYWHQVRQTVLRRDGWRCRHCGSAGHTPEPVFQMPRSKRGTMNMLIKALES